MEKEELLTGIQKALGSTKLQLSEQTMDAYAESVVSGVGEDVALDDVFIQRHVDFLKSLNGNFHKDVADEVKAYKAAHPAPKNAPTGDGAEVTTEPDDVPAWGKQLLARFESIETAAKVAKEEEAKNAVLKEAKKLFLSRQKEAGLSVREYFLGNAIKELEVPEKDADAEALSTELEKKYNRHLKSAGIDDFGRPSAGNKGTSGSGKSWLDAQFEAKKAREGGWVKK